MFMNLGVMAEYWIDSEAMDPRFSDSHDIVLPYFSYTMGKLFISKLYLKIIFKILTL